MKINKAKWLYFFSVVRGIRYRRKIDYIKGRFSVVGRVRMICENSEISFGRYVRLYNDVKLSVCGERDYKAKLIIGDNVAIGDRTEIHVGERVSIGNDTLISWD